MKNVPRDDYRKITPTNDGTGAKVTWVKTPKGEPPLCCPETKKNPNVKPVPFKNDTYNCPPEEGGCGSTFTKEPASKVPF